MVYSADEITRTDFVVEHQRLASLLSNKLKQEYSEMCGFIRDKMSLAIVRSNALIIRGARGKESYIL